MWVHSVYYEEYAVHVCVSHLSFFLLCIEKAKFETINNASLAWVHKVISDNIHSSFLTKEVSEESRSNEKASCSSNATTATKDDDKPAFIIIHGAGSFGHYHAKHYGLRGENLPPSYESMSTSKYSLNHYMSGLAQTRNSVKKLNNIVVSSLLSSTSLFTHKDEKKEATSIINAVGISPCINIPSLQAYGGNSQSASLLIQSIKEALQVGLVPVIHGDAGLYGVLDGNSYSNCSSRQIRSGILGGDTLVELIATSPLWDPKEMTDDKEDHDGTNNGMRQFIDEVVFLTDVNGVYTKDPNINPKEAKLLKRILIDQTNGEIDSVEVATNDGRHKEEQMGNESTDIGSLEIQGSSHEHDVTGGLKSKLSSAINVARKGIQVRIVKCCSKTAEDVLKGNETELGTTIINKK